MSVLRKAMLVMMAGGVSVASAAAQPPVPPLDVPTGAAQPLIRV